MADKVESGPLQQEFSIVGECEGGIISGIELGLERALAVAHGLALAGWRCKIKNADPFLEDPVVWEVWSESIP